VLVLTVKVTSALNVFVGDGDSEDSLLFVVDKLGDLLTDISSEGLLDEVSERTIDVVQVTDTDVESELVR